MSFDAPAALWLLLAVPAIVGLWLLRPRRPRLRIPSVMLWPTSLAERQSARPWQRLRNHPLLWLQVLVAALLAVAAARPFIPSEAAEQRVIVLLDASGSMRAHDVADVPSRWDAAVAATVDLARNLGPDQKLSVIRADDQPRILLADVRDASRVQAALDAEQPAYAPLDARTTVELAAGLAQGKPSEWILVGDGQFGETDSTAIPADTRLQFVPIGDEHAGNVALTALTVRANGPTLALQAALRNASTLPASGTVQLLTDVGTVVAASDWRADAASDAYVTWDGIQPGPRWFEARIASVTGNNVLETDDRAFVVADAATQSEQRALLVSSGNTFLERAMAVEGNLRTFKVPPTDLAAMASQGGTSGYALVVMDRQSRDALPNAGANTLWIGGTGGDDEFQPRLIAPRPDAALARNVDWSDVRIGRARRVDAEGWETVVDSDGGPLVLARTVRASDGTNRTLREAMLTFELGESDLPLRPAFPVLMANLLEWLAPRPETNLRPIAPGEALQLEASPLAAGLHVARVDGSLAEEDLAPPWPPRAFRPSVPGVYRVISDNPDGPSENLLVADAYSPSESDVARVTPALLHDSPSQLASALTSVRAGVWPWLLGALLLLAAAEWVVDARGR